MSTDNTQQSKGQEIDLIDLFKVIGDGVKSFFISIGKALTFLVFFGIRKIVPLIIIVAIGIGLGFLSFNLDSRYFNSDMTAQTNGINSADMIGYINNLHELCLEGNTEALADELSMIDTTAKKIKDIQAYFIVDVNRDGIGDFVDYENEIDLSDTTQQRISDRIHVEVSVFDNQAFSYVRSGLLAYMEKNPFLIQLNKIRIHELKELIEQTEYEIAKLDSLQDTDYFYKTSKLSSRTASQMMILAEKEPTMYYENKFELIEKKHTLQRELMLTNNSFTVIKDFNKMAKPENPLMNYIIKYVAIFLIIGYFTLLGITYRKELKQFIS